MRMTSLRKMLPIVALALALPSSIAIADDGAMDGVGGAMQLMDEHPTVVMDEMVVEAKLTPQKARVECRFRFRNTGKATTVRMGFPESGGGDGSGGGFTTFESWVDGKYVRTQVIPSAAPHYDGYERWRAKSVRFSEKQVRNVRVRYTAPLGRDTSGTRSFSYRVGTGGSWKGPIGRGIVRVDIDYDEAQYSVSSSDGLGHVGKHRYEWRRERFEPAPGAGVTVYLGARKYRVQIGPGLQELFPGDYSLVGGILLVPARELAGWMGAELHARPNGVSFTYGSSLAELQRGNEWLEVNGQRIPLPAKPYLSNGRTMVPLSAIVRVLGGEVKYEQANRVVMIRFPLRSAMVSAIKAEGPYWHQDWAIAEALRKLPGWAPPTREQYPDEVWEAAHQLSSREPWFAAGRFNRDNSTDFALLLCRGDELAMFVFYADGIPEQMVIAHRWEPAELDVNHVPFVLRTRPTGEVAYYAEGETTPKSGRLQLDYEGIELVVVGQAATLFYWDQREYRFKSVTIAD